MNKQNKNICIHVCDDNPVAIEKAIKITKDLLNEEGLQQKSLHTKMGISSRKDIKNEKMNY